ncbi:hypothetical protein DMA12_43235 [Amycolatopsis balhimycina DSM 5908]|uniref:Putative zinc-finger domain-containing protein n=1 Tax=Amycolatopsis balhimycina DSM 5908 TaxID=1081091 RepID=A0A428VY32_AMYBA|nr:hypothetical protein DMA12_43235 [Amycolatopsis balhimycina DSM 5908]
MDCQRCREAVSAMVDAQASPAEEAAAEIHLSWCPACRETAERLVVLTRLMRVRPAGPCPDFATSLLTAYDAHMGSGRTSEPDRPNCVPEHLVVWIVGTGRCDCAAGCSCGCQKGQSCRCHAIIT